MKKVFFVLIMIPSILTLESCKKDGDDPKIPQITQNEPETITTVMIDFAESGNTQNTLSFQWSDVDGAGGNAPVFDSIILDSATIYNVSIYFIDASSSEEVDLTNEVRQEGSDHFICFDLDEALIEEISISSTDSDGTYSIGLQSAWTINSSVSGELNIKLKHQPDGLKDGTCDPGETDVDVSFPVRIH